MSITKSVCDRILLDPALPASQVCSMRPTKVVKSATYVIDISKRLHPDDVMTTLVYGNTQDLIHNCIEPRWKMVMFVLKNVHIKVSCAEGLLQH